jgi:hypothetical protein
MNAEVGGMWSWTILGLHHSNCVKGLKKTTDSIT